MILFFKKLIIRIRLRFYKIENYRINDDLSIDVDGNVVLRRMSLTKIPFNFNRVSGNFLCSENNLRSLKGSPNYVGGDFSCSKNLLVNLVDSPIEVLGDFRCNINLLETLQGCSGEISGNLSCIGNRLTSLDTVSNIKGNIQCWNNQFQNNQHNFTGWCEGYIFTGE